MKHRILHLLPGTALVSSAGLIAGASSLNISASDTSHHKAQARSAAASAREEGIVGSLRSIVGWTSDNIVAAALPRDKLNCKRACHQREKPCRPVVLLSCGSFNPPTVAHLRMFELAADELIKAGYDMLGGYMSPVNDAYHKTGLAPARHRVEMCRLAAETSDIVMLDSWEAEQPVYQRSLTVLRRLDQALNDQPRGGMHADSNGATEQPRSSSRIKPMLLCGADMVESLAVPGVWKPEHVRTILGDYGVICISRENSNVKRLMDDPGLPLHEFSRNIIIVEDPITNNISSTVLREQVVQGRSIRYLVPDGVMRYITSNQLYR